MVAGDEEFGSAKLAVPPDLVDEWLDEELGSVRSSSPRGRPRPPDAGHAGRPDDDLLADVSTEPPSPIPELFEPFERPL